MTLNKIDPLYNAITDRKASYCIPMLIPQLITRPSTILPLPLLMFSGGIEKQHRAVMG